MLFKVSLWTRATLFKNDSVLAFEEYLLNAIALITGF